MTVAGEQTALNPPPSWGVHTPPVPTGCCACGQLRADRPWEPLLLFRLI